MLLYRWSVFVCLPTLCTWSLCLFLPRMYPLPHDCLVLASQFSNWIQYDVKAQHLGWESEKEKPNFILLCYILKLKRVVLTNLMAGDENGSPDTDPRNSLARCVLQERGAEIWMVWPRTRVLQGPRICRGWHCSSCQSTV